MAGRASHGARAVGLLVLLGLAACASAKVKALEKGCADGEAGACDVLAAMYLLGEDAPKDEAKAAALSSRAALLRSKACADGDKEACKRLGMVISAPVPLDVPRAVAGAEAQVVLRVELHKDGRILVEDKDLADFEALKTLAQEVRTKSPEVRALLAADPSVAHGRVISALDALKVAGISRIAFATGVAPPPASSSP